MKREYSDITDLLSPLSPTIYHESKVAKASYDADGYECWMKDIFEESSLSLSDNADVKRNRSETSLSVHDFEVTEGECINKRPTDNDSNTTDKCEKDRGSDVEKDTNATKDVTYELSKVDYGCPPRRRRRKEEVRVPDDGYYWLKYGQKDLTGSTYTRAYYRCKEKDKGCMAKRTVDRQKVDTTIIQIVYEEEHNHAPPLPIPVNNHSNISTIRLNSNAPPQPSTSAQYPPNPNSNPFLANSNAPKHKYSGSIDEWNLLKLDDKFGSRVNAASIPSKLSGANSRIDMLHGMSLTNGSQLMPHASSPSSIISDLLMHQHSHNNNLALGNMHNVSDINPSINANALLAQAILLNHSSSFAPRTSTSSSTSSISSNQFFGGNVGNAAPNPRECQTSDNSARALTKFLNTIDILSGIDNIIRFNNTLQQLSLPINPSTGLGLNLVSNVHGMAIPNALKQSDNVIINNVAIDPFSFLGGGDTIRIMDFIQ